MNQIKYSFSPLLCDEPQVLILGSIPGDRSIEVNQYYGHPRNRFWRVMCALYDCDVPTDYPSRIQMLATNKIALWDVACLAERKGSLDSAIRDEEPNDIHNLLQNNPTIKIVAFNGKKAEQLYNKYFKELSHIKYLSLPSTSPANAACQLDTLAERWTAILG